MQPPGYAARRFTTMSSRFHLSVFAIAMLAAAALWALPNWSASDPAQWTSDDVYQILTNSPWTKSVKMTFSNQGASALGNQAPGSAGNGSNGNWGNNGQTPGRMGGGSGGMGRRGMGGGRSSGTYNSGGSPSTNGGPSKSQPTQVAVQWQSALPVRLATAKKAGEAVSAGSLKPMDEYLIAVIGLPSTAVGGRAASADSDNTIDQDQQARIEDRVRSSASLLRSGRDPITPTRVQLDQGADGRMLIHFPKSNPITIADKAVEFRLAIGRTELRKKFTLKDMEYQGKLEL